MKGTSYILSRIIELIVNNTSEEILPEHVRELLTIITQSKGLLPYVNHPDVTYAPGETCTYTELPLVAHTTTSGPFNASHWRVVGDNYFQKALPGLVSGGEISIGDFDGEADDADIRLAFGVYRSTYGLHYFPQMTFPDIALCSGGMVRIVSVVGDTTGSMYIKEGTEGAIAVPPALLPGEVLIRQIEVGDSVFEEVDVPTPPPVADIFVDYCATQNMVLSGNPTAGFDEAGSTLYDNTTILLPHQTDKTENGVYKILSAGWIRLSGYDTFETLKGLQIIVRTGDSLANSVWKITSQEFTVGTNEIIIEELTNKSASLYKGTFASLAALQSAYPNPKPGWEAIVDDDSASGDAKKYIVDARNGEADGIDNDEDGATDESGEIAYAWVQATGASAASFATLTGSPEDNTSLVSKFANYVLTSAIANNLTTTTAGSVLDARQGKALSDSKQDIFSIKTASFTAVNDQFYVLTGSGTATDPTGSEGKGYRVYVLAGTLTLASVTYSAGMFVRRFYISGAWQTHAYYNKSALDTLLNAKANLSGGNDFSGAQTYSGTASAVAGTDGIRRSAANTLEWYINAISRLILNSTGIQLVGNVNFNSLTASEERVVTLSTTGQALNNYVVGEARIFSQRGETTLTDNVTTEQLFSISTDGAFAIPVNKLNVGAIFQIHCLLLIQANASAAGDNLTVKLRLGTTATSLTSRTVLDTFDIFLTPIVGGYDETHLVFEVKILSGSSVLVTLVSSKSQAVVLPSARYRGVMTGLSFAYPLELTISGAYSTARTGNVVTVRDSGNIQKY